MTKSEYQELVEFLGRKFDNIDRRFDAVEGRLTGVEERLTGVEVLGERDRDWTRVLAEAISSHHRKVDDFRDEMKEEFRCVRTEMAVGLKAIRSEMAKGFDGLGRRVTRLESLEA